MIVASLVHHGRVGGLEPALEPSAGADAPLA